MRHDAGMTIEQLRALIPNAAQMTDESLAGLYAELRGLAAAVVAGFQAKRAGADAKRTRRRRPRDGRECPWPPEWGFDALWYGASAGVRPPAEGTISA